MWLTSGLKPTYKTIADFRKNNPKALKAVFKDFVFILKGLALIGDNLVALDGAFLRALKYSDGESHTNKLVKQLPKNLKLMLKKSKIYNRVKIFR